MSESYCPYCGSISKPGESFCNNCGASLDSNVSPSTPTQAQPIQPYHQPTHQFGTPTQTTYVQTSTQASIQKNQAADLSLVFAIIGLFVIPGIGGLLAIIFGIIGLSNPYNRNKAVIGLILGILQSGAILSFLLFMF